MKKITDRVKAGQTDISSPKAYTFICVHAWTKGVRNVEETVNRLKKNPDVKVVAPETFMELIKRNVKH